MWICESTISIALSLLFDFIPAKAGRVGRKSAAPSADLAKNVIREARSSSALPSRRVWRKALRFSALRGFARSRALALDKNRRDPRGRRALDPFAAATLGIALAAARLGLAGACIPVPGACRA